ncbi:MAG: hypothetical protein Q4B82_02760 [Alysiella sp.]|uniref:CAP domain-containing protein n=1 Tax=Alysiella sp. TaxID=1872483 RepID=UPI0026DB3659|nr:CAP domain-containing protein [Alysiella sp.]MDO4433487.1 hypothetical protein [Alysiella sp.]
MKKIPIEEIVDIINQTHKCGRKHYTATPPLRLNDALQRTAQKHADDIAKKRSFSHASKDGRSPVIVPTSCPPISAKSAWQEVDNTGCKHSENHTKSTFQ